MHGTPLANGNLPVPPNDPYGGDHPVFDEASQLSTWRRVVGPFGCHAEGSAPSARS